MKKVILDTDIGVDCDDAAAIALLLEMESKGACRLECVTTSTTREGAAEAVRAILDYYGVCREIGKMTAPVLPCDATNAYAKAMKDRYGCEVPPIDSVSLLRRQLDRAEDKIRLIAIGPLSNMAGLLKSEGDAISALSGRELVNDKVDCLYIMGGSFSQNYPEEHGKGEGALREWNIVQDIASAQYVSENCPCSMVFCPHEAGSRVFTHMRTGNNPVWYAMDSFARYMDYATESGFQRESWDPVTCLAALEDPEPYFSLSDPGTVSVACDGETVHRVNSFGKTRFLRVKGYFEELESRINSLIRD